jgi:hypothetical protein
MFATSAGAEEIEHKFRVAVSVGGFSITDQQHSSAANVRALLKPDGQLDSFLQDPRNDSGAFSDFGLEPQYGGKLSVSYGVSRLWFVEASLGYRRGSVGNVQAQVFFDAAPTTAENPNNFAIYNFNAGTITQIPVEFTTGIRFRPKAAFNPYICFGIGYSFNSFSPSSEIDDLSLGLSHSQGIFTPVTGGTLTPEPGPEVALTGIVVDAPNAPEWHFGGGAEYTVARRWSIYLDARYTIYSGRFNMTVNGSNQLGISVPNDQILASDPNALGPFGTYNIDHGGLIDGGSYVPKPGFPGATCTNESHVNCNFTGPKDGIKDPGFYYIEAGRIRYDVVSYQIGFKYTF